MEENKNIEAEVVEVQPTAEVQPAEAQPKSQPVEPQPAAKAKPAGKGKKKITFGKIFGAALLAVVVGGLVKMIMWIGVLSSMGSISGEGVAPIPEEGILKINLSLPVTDAPLKDPFAGFDFATMSSTSSMTLYNVLQALDAAKSDDRIKGIYIMGEGLAMSATILEEVRAAVEEFKQSGKFVIAHHDTYSQWQYYFSSVADKVYIHPEGSFSWTGAAATTTFFKGLIDKLGVKVEILRPTACKYKSAVEPYFLKEMSPANRAQMQSMVDAMWEEVTTTVSKARNLSVEELNAMADNLSVVLPEEAVEHKLVDSMLYSDQVVKLLETEYVSEDFSFVDMSQYIASLTPDTKKLSAPQVAIVYANGQIVDGEGSDDMIYGNTLAQTIKDVAEDDEVKAVVVRVNSPGGSALASDIIWREMKLLQEKKPIVISMGEYAASGGYYISAPADAIVADKMTLTGSIGVFGMMPTIGPALERHLGITFDGVKTNAHADMGSGIEPLDNTEYKAVMRGVDRVYGRFTSLVAEGRNLPLEKVLEIAEGRVWMGSQAQQIGLVDTCGGIKAAIAIAIDKAALGEDYRIVEWTDEVEGFAAILKSLNVKVRSAIRSQSEMGRLMEEYGKIEHLVSESGIHVYCPYAMVEVR